MDFYSGIFMVQTTDISDFPVMKKRCKTCPFNPDGDEELQGRVISRLFQASQICHHPNLYGKPSTHLCRGARDYQLEIFHRLRVIIEPTDEAWGKAWEEMKVKMDRLSPKQKN
ncbi:hypothetical protein K9N68_37405 (plasmid) [Kovacikia minuta CCNUW1]|uniref:hypothetical protein n=1 Tax=Kovacikia minuta TaxID=2931930 RepID=UPI001CCEDF8D|nr:hypothetical protein [Kovacikia minuta]UBF29891.1 hypothetical protein K9N68_37405 [Kovacikia minuta CCNUW1]